MYKLVRLLTLLILIFSLQKSLAQLSSRNAGVTFRFDDYQSPAKLEKLRAIFNKHGKKMVYALNSQLGELRGDAAYFPTLKKMAEEGHELADQSPNDVTQYIGFSSNTDVNYYQGKSGVQSINLSNKKVLFKYYLKNNKGVGDEGKVRVEPQFLISEQAGEWEQNKLWSNYFTHIYLPSLNEVVEVNYINNRNPLDPDTLYYKSFWSEELSLNSIASTEYKKVSPYDLGVHDDAIRLMAELSLKIFAKYQLPQPKVFIHPGGSTPYLSADVIARIYGDEFHYKCGSTYPQIFNTYLHANRNGFNHFAIPGGDFTEEYKTTNEIKKIISNNRANHIHTISINHLNTWGNVAPIDTICKRIDELLTWCEANQIPVRTYSEVYEELFKPTMNLSENIFPRINTDLNADGAPDGIVMRSATLEKDAGVDSSFPDAFKCTQSAQMMIVKQLGGVTKGWNTFSIYSKGSANDWDNVGIYLSMPEADYSVVLSVNANSIDYVKHSFRFYVPDNVSYVSLYFNCNNSSKSNIYICGMEIKADSKPTILLKNITRNANEIYAVKDLRKEVRDMNFSPGLINWKIHRNALYHNATLVFGNQLRLIPNQKFWIGEDSIVLIAKNAAGNADTSTVFIYSYQPSGCIGKANTIAVNPLASDSAYVWYASPVDDSLEFKRSPVIVVYPTQNTTYYLDLYNRNNGGIVTHELTFNVNQPKQIGMATRDIAFGNSDTIVLGYDELNIPRCFNQCQLKSLNTTHQVKIYQSANKFDSIVIVKDSLLRNFSDFTISMSSVTCDDASWKIILNAAPVGIDQFNNYITKDPLIGPNPFSNALQVFSAAANAEFVLYNLNGKLMGKFDKTLLEQTDFTGYLSGIYLMQVKADNRVYHLKLIK